MEDNGTIFIFVVYVVMLTSMAFAASAFIAMNELSDVAPLLRTSWRAHVTSIATLPFLFYELYGQKNIKIMRNLSPEQRIYLLKWASVAAFGFLLYNFFFSWALDNTSLLNVMLLTNTCPLIVAFCPLLQCRAVDSREGIAALVGFAGGALAAHEGASEGQSSYYGDGLALLGAVGSIISIDAIGRMRKVLPLVTSIFALNLPVAIVCPIVCLLTGTAQITGLTSSSIFGYFAPERHTVIFYLAIGPGLISQSGMNFALRYTSTLTMALMVNTEPIWGTIIAMSMGTPTYLGPKTIMGGAMLLGAAAYVAWITRPEGKTACCNDDGGESGSACGGGGSCAKKIKYNSSSTGTQYGEDLELEFASQLAKVPPSKGYGHVERSHS